MRLLDRYLLREFLLPFAYCLAAFLIFWISFDLLSELDSFQEAKLKPFEVVQVYLYRIPDLLTTVLPVALLLGLLYALANHSRYHELTAMRAAGVSMWRITAPYFAVGIILSLLLFALNELIAPDGLEQADRIMRRHQVGSESSAGPWQKDLVFKNERENRDWHIAAFNTVTFELQGPKIAWKRKDGFRVQVFADRGAWTNGSWVFYDVQALLQSDVAGTKPIVVQTNEWRFVEFNETPAQIKSEIKIMSLSSLAAAKKVQLSIFEIRNYQRLHPYAIPQNRALLATQLQGRLAGPWTCLVVVLLGVALGARSGRRNMFVGAAGSVFLCFAYFIILRFGLALGTGGYIAPWLAAWLPNLIFWGTGMGLMKKAG